MKEGLTSGTLKKGKVGQGCTNGEGAEIGTIGEEGFILERLSLATYEVHMAVLQCLNCSS